MFKQVLISKDLHEKRVAFLVDSNLDEFYVERLDGKHLQGNIYKGKVESIVRGIQAAFIDIGIGKNGFLYVSDVINPASEYEIMFEEEIEGFPPKTAIYGTSTIEDLLKKEQEILVQIAKEPFGTKGARLTTHISLPGRYLVFMPYENHIGVSKKIESAKERKRLKEILISLKKKDEGGYIIRTAAAGCHKKDLIRDLKYLRNIWQKVKKLSEKRRAPSLIYEELDLTLRIIRDSFTEEINQVIIDSLEEYKKIRRFLTIFQPKLHHKLFLYKESIPLFEKYNLEQDIEKIFQRQINLRSGGSIVIEPTEALVAIDVNTAKFTKKKSLEETVFITNLEAAEEVARQIKLRDLGGIIIVDFIDMKKESARKKVLKKLQESIKSDKAKINIYGFSELGLVKLTRQRMRRNLESVSYEVCPYCTGRGLVKSEKTMAIQALRKLERYLQHNVKKSVSLSVHPFVAKRLNEEDEKLISLLERRNKTKINIVAKDDLHIEDFEIEGT
jgi:ribonuclease G